jgi:hypothetical protein
MRFSLVGGRWYCAFFDGSAPHNRLPRRLKFREAGKVYETARRGHAYLQNPTAQEEFQSALASGRGKIWLHLSRLMVGAVVRSCRKKTRPELSIEIGHDMQTRPLFPSKNRTIPALSDFAMIAAPPPRSYRSALGPWIIGSLQARYESVTMETRCSFPTPNSFVKVVQRQTPSAIRDRPGPYHAQFQCTQKYGFSIDRARTIGSKMRNENPRL